MDRELRVEISEAGADAERVATLTGYLRAELLQLDIENVKTPRAGEAPPGARAVDPATIGALLVALGESAKGLLTVVSVVKDWLRRGEGTSRTVRLELDGDSLELRRASAADQERLIEMFVSRHAGQGGGQGEL